MRRQCALLHVNRSTLYYQEQGGGVEDATLLNMMRDIWERYPFFGYRRITQALRTSGLQANHKRVHRLMVLGGIDAIFPGPHTSKRHKAHAVYPYLLAGLPITRVNQVWMVDITYLRMPKGFVYLVAIIDVYSRYVVGWSISNTLETDSCLTALKSAFMLGKPEIVHSDQGSQFTSHEWTHGLHDHHISISMTGKGRCMDNIYIERFWRSFKQEEFYLNEYGSVRELKQCTGAYMTFYNHKRWHQSLGYKRPADVYFATAEQEPVDRCTNPSDQTVPVGTCGQAMDNANALPTA